MKGNRLAGLAGPAAHDGLSLWEGFEEQREVGTGNTRKTIKGEMAEGRQVGSGSPARKEFGLCGDVKTFQPDTGSTSVWLGVHTALCVATSKSHRTGECRHQL